MGRRQVPPHIRDAGARISSRRYDSAFARLPDDETVSGLEDGAGPEGTVDSGPRNLALIAMAAGFALVFATLLVQHWLPLLAGIVLFVAGGLWALWRNRPLRLSRGLGPVRPGRHHRG